MNASLREIDLVTFELKWECWKRITMNVLLNTRKEESTLLSYHVRFQETALNSWSRMFMNWHLFCVLSFERVILTWRYQRWHWSCHVTGTMWLWELWRFGLQTTNESTFSKISHWFYTIKYCSHHHFVSA